MRSSPKYEEMQVAATANSNGRSMIVTDDADGSYSVWAVHVTGTFDATVNFEGTLDGTTWVPLPMIDAESSSEVLSTSSPGMFYGNVSALALVRARISAYVSGSVTVKGQAVSTALGVRLSGGGAAAPVATYTVTTTAPAQTHTINSLGVSASTVVDWGDGSDNAYTGTAQRTHVYAAAGTYTVTIDDARNVTTFDVRDNKVTLNSADIARMVNVQTFVAIGLKAGRFDSADVSAWRPTFFSMHSMPSSYAGTFYSADVSAWRPVAFTLYSMPAGYAGTFNSADVGAWRPGNFYLLNMPAGYAGTFNSADVSAWRPGIFYLHSMPTGYTITAGGGFASWTTGLNNFQMQGNGLLTATVNAILWELYQAATTRTGTGGTINVGGSNQAPSGTFQAAAACPVTVATPGKEIAHELLNDGCGAITNHWATVTVTA